MGIKKLVFFFSLGIISLILAQLFYSNPGEENLIDMKTVVTLLGFIAFTAFTVKDRSTAIYGVWQGAYGMNDEIKNAWVVFGNGNSMEFYDGDLKAQNKMTGTYSLLGDTAIVFTYKNPNVQQLIKMEGNINRTKSFVDGSWQSNNNQYGSFFLQKQR